MIGEEKDSVPIQLRDKKNSNVVEIRWLRFRRTCRQYEIPFGNDGNSWRGRGHGFQVILAGSRGVLDPKDLVRRARSEPKPSQTTSYFCHLHLLILRRRSVPLLSN